MGKKETVEVRLENGMTISELQAALKKAKQMKSQQRELDALDRRNKKYAKLVIKRNELVSRVDRVNAQLAKIEADAANHKREERQKAV